VPLSDRELLDLGDNAPRGYDPRKARRDLKTHGDVFRAQLVVARGLDGDVARDAVAAKSPTSDRTWLDGHSRALRELAANLRLGRYLPGGDLHDAATGG